MKLLQTMACMLALCALTLCGSVLPAAAAAKAALPAFQKGDTVIHKAFGKGLVTGLTPMGGDALIEIAFDNVGTKRLMLKAAAQHMTKT